MPCSHRLSFLLLVLAARPLSAADETAVWKTIPLIEAGRVAPGWAHIGWGQMTPVDGSLRTDCDERGMGLLVYTKQKLGDCEIRVVYRPQNARSNAGVFIRVADGILDWVGKPSVEVHRDADGKLPPAMLDKLKAASEKEEGVWYAVHHGHEVQIMDGADEVHRTGAIYSLSTAAPPPATAVPSPTNAGDWRTMIIALDGTQVRVSLDGQEVTRFDSQTKDLPPRKQWYEPKRDAVRPATGYMGLQNHDPGDVVYFKEISYRPLVRN